MIRLVASRTKALALKAFHASGPPYGLEIGESIGLLLVLPVAIIWPNPLEFLTGHALIVCANRAIKERLFWCRACIARFILSRACKLQAVPEIGNELEDWLLEAFEADKAEVEVALLQLGTDLIQVGAGQITEHVEFSFDNCVTEPPGDDEHVCDFFHNYVSEVDLVGAEIQIEGALKESEDGGHDYDFGYDCDYGLEDDVAMWIETHATAS